MNSLRFREVLLLVVFAQITWAQDGLKCFDNYLPVVNSGFFPLRPLPDLKPEKVGHLASTLSDINSPHYAKANRILLLSDGWQSESGENTWSYSMGLSLAERYPDKTVVRSDYGHLVHSRNKNLLEVRMDNTKVFPFADNSFQAITMIRGLCLCENGRACGGIEGNSMAAANFFVETGRVLDKQNPNSAAYLEGAKNNSKSLPLWEDAAKRAMQLSPSITVEVITNNKGEFSGVRITPRSR